MTTQATHPLRSSLSSHRVPYDRMSYNVGSSCRGIAYSILAIVALFVALILI